MSEEKAKEEKPKEVKAVTITLNGEFRYYDKWKGIFATYISPEVDTYLDVLEQYGVEKWKVVEYALEKLLEKDPKELAGEIALWDTKNIIDWKEQKEKGGK